MVVDDPIEQAKIEWQLPTKKGYTNVTTYQRVGERVTQFPLPGTSNTCTFIITVKGEFLFLFCGVHKVS